MVGGIAGIWGGFFLLCVGFFVFVVFFFEKEVKLQWNLLLNGPIFCQSSSECICCLNLSISQAQPIAKMIQILTCIW